MYVALLWSHSSANFTIKEIVLLILNAHRAHESTVNLSHRSTIEYANNVRFYVTAQAMHDNRVQMQERFQALLASVTIGT